MITVPMAPGVKTVRYQAPKHVELPNGQVPLVHPSDPDHAQVQERYIAHTRQFRLWIEEERLAYEEVFQNICDGLAILSEQRVDFAPEVSGYTAFIRWSTVSLIAPKG